MTKAKIISRRYAVADTDGRVVFAGSHGRCLDYMGAYYEAVGQVFAVLSRSPKGDCTQAYREIIGQDRAPLRLTPCAREVHPHAKGCTLAPVPHPGNPCATAPALAAAVKQRPPTSEGLAVIHKYLPASARIRR